MSTCVHPACSFEGTLRDEAMSHTRSKLVYVEDELHEVARRETSLSDFGDQTYKEGLRVLLHAFDNDQQLTESGWQSAYDGILRILRARLYSQRGWIEHPEVRKIPIQRPVVIIGLPRTGSTALHRLLAVDAQFQALETWLTEAPMIRPLRETWDTYTAYRACIANFEALYARLPELRKGHVFAADEVEECTLVLMQNFESSVWIVHQDLPTYARWFETRSARESYHRYVNVLRLIGAREPQRRWLLKSPHHTAELDSLFEVLPDACIIQTHRDPLMAIPSFCSGIYSSRKRDLDGQGAKPEIIGPKQCAYWRKILDRVSAVRDRPGTKFCDVDHRRFIADPLGVVRSIYDCFDLTLSPDIEEKMRAWVNASPTSRHGKHEYLVDSWGLTSAQICEYFAHYRAEHHFN